MSVISLQREKPLIVVIGPTGVGKTRLGIEIASVIQGEILSADSRQVYRDMNIGTAKPELFEQAVVPHHLIDILDPDEWLTVSEFQSRASDTIASLHAQSIPPVLVGGTGQYVRALLEGWQIPEVEPRHALRGELLAFTEVYSPVALVARLDSLDYETARKIDWMNVRRVIRALEVTIVTGTQFSQLNRQQSPPYDVLKIGLTLPRDLLYHRVDARIDQMISRGLIEEVKCLVDLGYGWELPAMNSLGYIQFRDYLCGKVSLEEAANSVKTETHRFIRQQYNWFRLSDPSIHWFDASEVETSEIVDQVSQWLKGGSFQ